MSNKDNGEPAFPTARVTINGIDETEGIEAYGPGMTLRDYFAAKAMQAYITNLGVDDIVETCVAEWSYEIADSMLEARNAS